METSEHERSVHFILCTVNVCVYLCLKCNSQGDITKKNPENVMGERNSI